MSISLALSVPGAIPNLDALKAEIALWLDRDDLEARIPTFVAMAEAEFNRELRTPQMERTLTFSASDEDQPLPSDYLAMRNIYIEGSPDRPLRGMAPTAQRIEFDGSSGTPQAYILVSGGLRLVPPPSSAILLTMDYFGRIDALSAVAPSNWLLENHPDAYLYGALFYAEAYLDNAIRASQWRGLFDQALQRIGRAAQADRYGAGPLVPNTMRQVRGVRI